MTKSKQKQLTDKQKELMQCSKSINTYWTKLTNKHQHYAIPIDKFEKLTEILWLWGEMLNKEMKEYSKVDSQI